MKKDMRFSAPILKFLAICFVLLINLSCTNSNPLVPANTAVIEGTVVESDNLRPVQGVLVRSFSFAESAMTDGEGKYSLSVQLPDTSARAIELTFSRTNYTELSIPQIIIQNGTLTNVPAAIITRTGEVTVESGPASNVILVEISTSSIFVKSSGANETSKITFEVRDSSGIPVDLKNQVKVCFLVKGGPNGGEFVSPDSVLTDINGRAVTTVNSGTIAGALQVVAEVAGTTITSSPVPISIHGWLPDQNHFAVVSARINFAGYNQFGLENLITAFVGDKFSNPVPPGTSVRFSSTGGIIEGSSVTDEFGKTSVKLISTEPRPQGVPNRGFLFNQPGFALVTAQTVDENQLTITVDTIVLFSGITQLTNVSPTSFRLGGQNNPKSQVFTFTVSDQNSNPLVAGTSISVLTSVGTVTGDINVSLGDIQARGPGATQFTFRLVNSDPDQLQTPEVDVAVTIAVSSQNGDASFVIEGTMLR